MVPKSLAFKGHACSSTFHLLARARLTILWDCCGQISPANGTRKNCELRSQSKSSQLLYQSQSHKSCNCNISPFQDSHFNKIFLSRSLLLQTNECEFRGSLAVRWGHSSISASSISRPSICISAETVDPNLLMMGPGNELEFKLTHFAL
jgi:hypothetical protein